MSMKKNTDKKINFDDSDSDSNNNKIIKFPHFSHSSSSSSSPKKTTPGTINNLTFYYI